MESVFDNQPSSSECDSSQSLQLESAEIMLQISFINAYYSVKNSY